MTRLFLLIYLLTYSLMEQSPSWEANWFSAFYGTQRFIAAFTNARHLFLSWARSIQFMPSHPTYWISFLMTSHLCLALPSGLVPSGFPTEILYAPLLSPIHATCSAHLNLLDLITRTILGEEYRSWSSQLCSFLHSLVTSSLLGSNILLTPDSQTPSAYFPSSMWATKFHTHAKKQAKLYLCMF